MKHPYKYIKNVSDKPVPEPATYTAVELREKADYERREHLESYDPVKQRYPLAPPERDKLEMFRRRDKLAAPIILGGTELRFAPGQVYEVPAYIASRILSANERLQEISYDQARTESLLAELHVETPADARRLAAVVSSGDDDILGRLAIDYKDGSMTRGGGIWETCPTDLPADIQKLGLD